MEAPSELCCRLNFVREKPVESKADEELGPLLGSTLFDEALEADFASRDGLESGAKIRDISSVVR